MNECYITGHILEDIPGSLRISLTVEMSRVLHPFVAEKLEDGIRAILEKMEEELN